MDQPNDLPEPPASGEKKIITVKELDQLVVDIFDQKAKIEQMEKDVSKENIQLAKLEAKAVAYLEEIGRDSYKTARGQIGIKEKWRWNLPSTDEDKAAFFDYLRERGLYDKYATVNSASYNSFLAAEWEIAKEEGRGMEFSIPGVPEPKFYRGLSTLKGK